MKKNQKKIVGTLLGLMASISGTKAVPKSSIKGDINTGITSSDNKDGKQSEFKNRSEAQTNPYLMAAKFICEGLLANEAASTIPYLKKVSRTLFRPYFSNYRIAHGFRGYVYMHDDPKLVGNVFKLTGDDGHDFRARVGKGDNFFGNQEEVYTIETSAVESPDTIENLNNNVKFQLKRYTNEPYVNLVAEAKIKNAPKYCRLFEAKKIWTIDDVAYAIGQANKLIDIINDPKMSAEQKKNKIIKKFGKKVVFVPKDNNGTTFRIYLGKKKFPTLDVKEVVNEKFWAQEIGGDINEDIENEGNQNVINEATKKLDDLLKASDQSQGLKCYAEFELISV